MLAAVLGLVVASSGPPQLATSHPPSHLALDWETTTPSCLDHATIIEQLGALLPELPPPRSLAETPDAALRVTGSLAALDEARWEIRLRFESARGVDERSFAGEDCAALGQATALVIAVAVDPLMVTASLARARPTDARGSADVHESTDAHQSADVRESADTREPADARESADAREPPTQLEPSTSPTPDPTQSPEPRPRRTSGLGEAPSETATQRWRPRLGVSAFAGGGYGPISAGFATIGGELTLLGQHWRAGVSGRWHPPRILALSQGQVRHESFAFDLRGCGVPSWRALEFPLCAAVELGSVRGRGVGATPDPQTAGLLWVALSPGAGLRWVLDERIALGVDVHAPVSLVRGGFRIGDAVVSRLTPVGVRALALLELRFSP